MSKKLQHPVFDSSLNNRGKRRSNPVPTILFTLLLLGGAGFAVTSHFSREAEKTAQDLSTTLNAQFAGVDVLETKQQDYKRGLLNSSQDLEMTVNTGQKPLKIILHNDIQHGPVLGVKGLGQAHVKTTFEFADPALQEQWKKFISESLSNKEPTLETFVDMLGNKNSSLRIPQGHLKDGQDLIDWGEIYIDSSEKASKMNSKVRLSDVLFQSGEEKLELVGLNMDYRHNTKDKQSLLGDNDFSLYISRLYAGSHNEMTDENIQLKNISLKSAVKNTGEHSNATFKYAADHVNIGNLIADKMQMHFSVNNLDDRSLLYLESLEQGVTQLNGAVFRLLSKNAVFNIDRLAINKGSQEFFMSAQLSAPKLAEQNAMSLRMLNLSPHLMLPMLKFEIQGHAHKDMLQEILQMPTLESQFEGQNTEAMLNSLIEQGYISKAGNKLTYNVKLDEGKVYVGDKQIF